jgi:NADH-quinone oxidoreductase subunit D
MKQCLREMPEGPVASDDRKVVPPKRAEMKQSMEALIHHFKLYTEGFHVPAGESMSRPKAPRANSASIWSATAATSPIAARSARPPSRTCRRWICACASGHMLTPTPVTAILGAIDVVFGECDR